LSSSLARFAILDEGLDVADFGLELFGKAASPERMALPISLEAALRLSCLVCNSVSARAASSRDQLINRGLRLAPTRALHQRIDKSRRVVANPFDIKHVLNAPG
jgi:hypothetical protein